MSLLDHALRRGGDIVVATVHGLDPADVTPLDVIDGRARLNTEAPVLYCTPRHRNGVDDTCESVDAVVQRALTRKRLETLINRLKRKLAWLDEMHGRPQELRRTGATFIERDFGTAVAQRWLRHTVHTEIGTLALRRIAQSPPRLASGWPNARGDERFGEWFEVWAECQR